MSTGYYAAPSNDALGERVSVTEGNQSVLDMHHSGTTPSSLPSHPIHPRLTTNRDLSPHAEEINRRRASMGRGVFDVDYFRSTTHSQPAGRQMQASASAQTETTSRDAQTSTMEQAAFPIKTPGGRVQQQQQQPAPRWGVAPMGASVGAPGETSPDDHVAAAATPYDAPRASEAPAGGGGGAAGGAVATPRREPNTRSIDRRRHSGAVDPYPNVRSVIRDYRNNGLTYLEARYGVARGQSPIRPSSSPGSQVLNNASSGRGGGAGGVYTPMSAGLTPGQTPINDPVEQPRRFPASMYPPGGAARRTSSPRKVGGVGRTPRDSSAGGVPGSGYEFVPRGDTPEGRPRSRAPSGSVTAPRCATYIPERYKYVPKPKEEEIVPIPRINQYPPRFRKGSRADTPSGAGNTSARSGSRSARQKKKDGGTPRSGKGSVLGTPASPALQSGAAAPPAATDPSDRTNPYAYRKNLVFGVTAPVLSRSG